MRSCLLLFIILTTSFQSIAKDPDEIFANSINGIVYIRNFLPDGSSVSGSGVLVNRSRRLVFTNAHVIKKEKTVSVFFPARDGNGALIGDRSYYADNRTALRSLGIAVTGRVAAIDELSDLAILRLSGVPESAKALEFAPDLGVGIQRDDRVHILGNPGGRDLWQWSQGSYVGRIDIKGDGLDFQALNLFGTAYFGNSGGAVLNNSGKVIGITQSKAGEGSTKVYAVDQTSIEALLATVKKKRAFSIENRTKSALNIQVSGCMDEVRQDQIPAGRWISYPCDNEHPTVTFKYTAPDGNEVKKDTGVETYSAYYGFGGSPDRELDCRAYHMRWVDGHLTLFDSEK